MIGYLACSALSGLSHTKKRVPRKPYDKSFIDKACSVKGAIANLDYRAHSAQIIDSAPLFSKLWNLDIYQINTFQIAKCMYCYHDNNLLPPLFFNLFLTNSQIHSCSTRTAYSYRVHHCRSNLKIFTILYQGPKIWNSLCQIFFVKFSQF